MRAFADAARPVAEVSPMIYGQFIEHFHRQVYGGIFEPGSPRSDGDGFREDVLEALRALKVPVVRWPGGYSAYHWNRLSRHGGFEPSDADAGGRKAYAIPRTAQL